MVIINTMRNLSVIIPLRNSEKKLSVIFERLNTVSIPRDLNINEVIFIDNGSSDNTFTTATLLSREYPNLNAAIISYKKKVDAKKAARLGLSHATSKLNLIIRPNLADMDVKLNRLSSKLLRQKKAHIPLLSVVMPVYNAEKFLAQAINSIMKQTFRDFEFIIVDDASTDQSYQIAQRFAKRYPDRIKLFRNEKNVKQAKTVNFAIQKTRGDYIARMDADDIALPMRFERQIEYLKNNPKTVAVGSQCLIINENGRVTGEKTFPTSFEEIHDYIFKFCPAQQPSLMIAKKRLPKDFEYYDHDLSPVEDTEFIFKLFKYGRVENMPEYFLLYRIHGNNSSLMSVKKSFCLTLLSRLKGVFYHGYRPTPAGILFTVAQAVAVFLLPQKLSQALYKFVKAEMKSEKSRNTHKRLAYHIAKSL